MNVTVDKQKKSRPEKYPKLMRDNETGLMVLFTSESVGTVVCGADNGMKSNGVGKYCDSWIMSYFTDFHGTITLEND